MVYKSLTTLIVDPSLPLKAILFSCKRCVFDCGFLADRDS